MVMPMGDTEYIQKLEAELKAANLQIQELQKKLPCGHPVECLVDDMCGKPEHQYCEWCDDRDMAEQQGERAMKAEVDLKESNRLIDAIKTPWENYHRGIIDVSGVIRALMEVFPTIERPVHEVVEQERAALLDPKSPGWDAGADRLLNELKDRKQNEKREASGQNDHCITEVCPHCWGEGSNACGPHRKPCVECQGTGKVSR